MSVAILSSLTNGTGNKTTAHRICSYLQDEQYNVYLCDSNRFESSQLFNAFINENNVQAVIAIHLVRAGRLLVGLPIPYLVISGGTDMNIFVEDKDAVSLMTEVVKNATYFIVFTDSVRKMAANMWPSFNKKVLVQPQSVCAAPVQFTFEDLFRQFKQVEMNFEDMKIFLIIGGIRPVKLKDPLYIAEVISHMHSADPSVYLVIIGPELDKEYTAQCREIIKNLKGVYIFAEVSPEKVYSLMKQSFALVNSSESEGMSGAILEAMYLGTPVIARKNEGNMSIISNNENGLIYTSREEFRSKALLLLSDQYLRQMLIRNGKLYIQENHAVKKEKEMYVMLMRELVRIL